MMYKVINSIFLLQLLVIPCLAQVKETMPIINADNSVTFIYQDKKADEVKIDGSMMKPKYKIKTMIAPIQGSTAREMEKEGGEWTYTTKTLDSDMYTYHFKVDESDVLDPNNPNTVRDVADTLNYFIIGGGIGEYYRERYTCCPRT